MGEQNKFPKSVWAVAERLKHSDTLSYGAHVGDLSSNLAHTMSRSHFALFFLSFPVTFQIFRKKKKKISKMNMLALLQQQVNWQACQNPYK